MPYPHQALWPSAQVTLPWGKAAGGLDWRVSVERRALPLLGRYRELDLRFPAERRLQPLGRGNALGVFLHLHATVERRALLRTV